MNSTAAVAAAASRASSSGKAGGGSPSQTPRPVCVDLGIFSTLLSRSARAKVNRLARALAALEMGDRLAELAHVEVLREDRLHRFVGNPADQLVFVAIFLVHRELDLAAPRCGGKVRQVAHSGHDPAAAPWISDRRSAFEETTFSRFAIDIRTETPDAWFTCGDDRAARPFPPRSP